MIAHAVDFCCSLRRNSISNSVKERISKPRRTTTTKKKKKKKENDKFEN